MTSPSHYPNLPPDFVVISPSYSTTTNPNRRWASYHLRPGETVVSIEIDDKLWRHYRDLNDILFNALRVPTYWRALAAREMRGHRTIAIDFAIPLQPLEARLGQWLDEDL